MADVASSVLESLPDLGAAVLDPGGVIVRWNRAAERLTGVPAADAAGRDFAWLYGDTATGRPDAPTLLAQAEHEPQHYGGRRLRADGTPYWYTATLFAVRDAAGELQGLAELARDVTEARDPGRTDVVAQRERLLRENERRLAEAEAIAQIGSWDYDLRTGRAHWSAGMLALHDMTAEDLAGRVDAFYDVLHPDDRAWVQPIIDGAASAGGRFEFECRVVLRDGAIRLMQVVGEVFTDATGQPDRMAGITFDVTDARAAEPAGEDAGTDDRLERLTPRQLQILGLVAEGLAAHEIAGRLDVDEAAVTWDERRIQAVLGVHTRDQMAAHVRTP